METLDTSTIILEELRELRSAYTEWSKTTAERLSALETDMKSVVGNGRKGRLESVEENIDDLKAWRWRIAGISTGASTVVSVLAYLVFKH